MVDAVLSGRGESCVFVPSRHLHLDGSFSPLQVVQLRTLVLLCHASRVFVVHFVQSLSGSAASGLHPFSVSHTMISSCLAGICDCGTTTMMINGQCYVVDVDRVSGLDSSPGDLL